jgi:[ribosomal protein S18]-alanine N-acetyltransferase
MTTTIRPYRSSDFETLYAIDHQCFERELAYDRSELRGYLRLPGAECLIAESDGEVAAFVVAAHENGLGYIVTLDVLEAYRRQGVAATLLTAAERRLADDGVRAVELETATDNAPAIAFWQKHGYRTCGIRKEYYPDGRDAYSMIKPLGEGPPVSSV